MLFQTKPRPHEPKKNKTQIHTTSSCEVAFFMGRILFVARVQRLSF
jgi:hypothetical protein